MYRKGRRLKFCGHKQLTPAILIALAGDIDCVIFARNSYKVITTKDEHNKICLSTHPPFPDPPNISKTKPKTTKEQKTSLGN